MQRPPPDSVLSLSDWSHAIIAGGTGVAYVESPWPTFDDGHPEAIVYAWAIPPVPVYHVDARP